MKIYASLARIIAFNVKIISVVINVMIITPCHKILTVFNVHSTVKNAINLTNVPCAWTNMN